MKEVIKIVLAEGLFVFQSVCPVSAEFKDEYIQQFTDAQKPHRYFQSDEWVVEALFFDFNGDGYADEALLASPDQRYTDGCSWLPSRYVKGKGVLVCTNICDGTSVYCRNDRFYKLELLQSPKLLVGRDITVAKREGNVYHQRYVDAIIGIDSNLCFKVLELEHGMAAFVLLPCFRRLDSLTTELYKGFRVKRQQPYSVNASRESISNKRVSIGRMGRPCSFDLFINGYRQKVKEQPTINRRVTVYAVFFDADNDGDVDFYMSSDVEERQNGQYEWHLYLNDGGRFAKAKKTVWFNVGKDYNRESIEPDETASMNSFYRVQRVNGFAPSVIILDRDGTALHSRAALRQRLSQPPIRQAKRLSQELEREYYNALEEWQGSQKAKLGFIPAYDFDELISGSDFLRLERLECEVFPEK